MINFEGRNNLIRYLKRVDEIQERKINRLVLEVVKS